MYGVKLNKIVNNYGKLAQYILNYCDLSYDNVWKCKWSIPTGEEVLNATSFKTQILLFKLMFLHEFFEFYLVMQRQTDRQTPTTEPYTARCPTRTWPVLFCIYNVNSTYLWYGEVIVFHCIVSR